uniref:Uncharacterized protein n=1 Tax=Anguilla anguilla TaxID=7936 RepID=A0A0E9WD65_ANGAN
MSCCMIMVFKVTTFFVLYPMYFEVSD